jgi:hypothetical protein
MSSKVCAYPKCVCEAVEGDKCAIHKQFEVARTEHCSKCSRKIRAGTWAKKNPHGLEHIGACPKATGAPTPARVH